MAIGDLSKTKSDLSEYISHMIREKLITLYAEGFSLTDAMRVLTEETINRWIVEWYKNKFDRHPPTWLANWGRDEKEV